MLAVISPAKNLDFETPVKTQRYSQPDFLDESKQLIETCRQLSPIQLASLMKISDKLAGLNAARFASWSLPFTPDNARQAVLAFNGDVYAGLSAQQFNQQQLDYSQRKLRILSGLYGLLKPLDLIQPYRLEMGTKLINSKGKDLYTFWGNQLTDSLNQHMQTEQTDVLVNLASQEYFKVVQVKDVEGKIISPVFKDFKNGQFKIISFYAKKARGLMARYIVEHQLQQPEQLQSFDSEGYCYAPQFSSDTVPVFTRKL